MRFLNAKNNDAEAYQHKRKKRPNIRKVNHFVNIGNYYGLDAARAAF